MSLGTMITRHASDSSTSAEADTASEMDIERCPINIRAEVFTGDASLAGRLRPRRFDITIFDGETLAEVRDDIRTELMSQGRGGTTEALDLPPQSATDEGDVEKDIIHTESGTGNGKEIDISELQLANLGDFSQYRLVLGFVPNELKFHGLHNGGTLIEPRTGGEIHEERLKMAYRGVSGGGTPAGTLTPGQDQNGDTASTEILLDLENEEQLRSLKSAPINDEQEDNGFNTMYLRFKKRELILILGM